MYIVENSAASIITVTNKFLKPQKLINTENF